MSKDTGGQAFPQYRIDDSGDGMTLRDWFAGQALSGIVSRKGGGTFDTYIEITELAYAYADSMIKERGK